MYLHHLPCSLGLDSNTAASDSWAARRISAGRVPGAGRCRDSSAEVQQNGFYRDDRRGFGYQFSLSVLGFEEKRGHAKMSPRLHRIVGNCSMCLQSSRQCFRTDVCRCLRGLCLLYTATDDATTLASTTRMKLSHALNGSATTTAVHEFPTRCVAYKAQLPAVWQNASKSIAGDCGHI